MPQETPNLQKAIEVLGKMLDNPEGKLSTKVLVKELKAQGVEEAECEKIKYSLIYFDFGTEVEPGGYKPDFQWKHHGRSFYTLDGYEKFIQEQKQDAEQAEKKATAAVEEEKPEEEETPQKKRKNKGEESRLGRYVAGALEILYQSEYGPEEAEYVFDVHSDRPGNKYENVDLMAVHWRSDEDVELVTVEVKLDFTAELIQQARNYCRFSDRVWIAVPVSIPQYEATYSSTSIRDLDPLLFDHVVESGLGILVCRRAKGKSYEVFPVHWPRKNNPDTLEKKLFVKMYQAKLAEAGVVREEGQEKFPIL